MDDFIRRKPVLTNLWDTKRNVQMMDDTQSADKIMLGLRLAESAVTLALPVDAVEVVRCHDCKHLDEEYGCSMVLWGRNKLEYCSLGERK